MSDADIEVYICHTCFMPVPQVMGNLHYIILIKNCTPLLAAAKLLALKYGDTL